MKTKLSSVAVLGWLLSAATLLGTPLTETTAVHTKPDAASPAISYLKAGSEPTAAANATAPDGWMAVELAGPFAGYAETKDFTKGLDVKPGAPIRLAPEPTAPVLKTAERGDKTTITGLHGRWTQISLTTPLVGYIRVNSAPTYAAPAPAPAAPAESAPMAPAPVAPLAYGTGAAGQPVPTVNLVDNSTLPRQFAGIFVSTRSVFHPRRPYDWALNDNAGKRFAYLDISKLLLTDQPEKYIGHRVAVFGAPKPTADGKDIVIQVESLQLQ